VQLLFLIVIKKVQYVVVHKLSSHHLHSNVSVSMDSIQTLIS